ncbi:hypothetical protein [Cumulibacter soli]|uniref:hypothetical protein n=1 Tax=Cumulibacter soli TaxID=2546344 RepID=UPI001068223F|nr:hypothetical protein [Cumulibacter soli]
MDKNLQVDGSLLDRLQPAAGVLVLTASAVPWISRAGEYYVATGLGTDPSYESIELAQSPSLWGLFGAVNVRVVGALAIGVAVILAFAITAILVRRRPAVILSLALACAFATSMVMLATDSGYSIASGLYLTLGAALATVAAAIRQLVRPARN